MDENFQQVVQTHKPAAGNPMSSSSSSASPSPSPSPSSPSSSAIGCNPSPNEPMLSIGRTFSVSSSGGGGKSESGSAAAATVADGTAGATLVLAAAVGAATAAATATTGALEGLGGSSCRNPNRINTHPTTHTSLSCRHRGRNQSQALANERTTIYARVHTGKTGWRWHTPYKQLRSEGQLATPQTKVMTGWGDPPVRIPCRPAPTAAAPPRTFFLSFIMALVEHKDFNRICEEP